MDNLKMDPQLAAMSTPPYHEAIPPQEEVDDFLRKKRKAREHKACYPCRQRKVKCDLSRPCQTCRDRDHPELCSYHPPNKRQNQNRNVEQNAPVPPMQSVEPVIQQPPPGSGETSVTLGRAEFDMLCRKLNGLEKSISDLKRELRRNAPVSNGHHDSDESEGVSHQHSHTDVHGIHTKNESGEIVHLGGGSIPAMLYTLSRGNAPTNEEQDQLTEFLGKSVLPLFGLDNESATYPFVDLWGLPHGSLQRAKELARALPGDQQMLTLFRAYRDLGHVIYPGLAELEQLETDLSEFLLDRGSLANLEDGVTEQMLYGKSFYWLGQLFAVLASGAQCSALTRKERELTSQVYVCCAFECLRFTNFLSQPHKESIQALVIIGNVMTNNMNAGTAWSVLGLTIRLAQGLGLHRACPSYVSPSVVFPRAKIWWAIVWQDSLLSITYDRNAALDVSTMPMPQTVGSIGSYHSSMYRLSKIVLDIVHDRGKVSSPREVVAQINQHREAIANVMQDAGDHLRDSRSCSTIQETLEHWALYLHTSYAMSELCRPALSRQSSHEIKSYKTTCVENLINVVEAFLGLNNITFFARQSWAAVHRGLSSALLLGILGEHTWNERARKLIGRFMTLMTEVTATVDPSEVSAPVQRGIAALRKLHIEEPRASSFIADMANTKTLAEGLGIDGAARPEQKQVFTPSNSDSTGEEDNSPYSVLNSILWGNENDHLHRMTDVKVP